MTWFYRFFAVPTALLSALTLVCTFHGHYFSAPPPKWLAAAILLTTAYGLTGGLIDTSNLRRFLATPSIRQLDVAYLLSLAWNIWMLFHGDLIRDVLM